jgi:hypothetical protein
MRSYLDAHIYCRSWLLLSEGRVLNVEGVATSSKRCPSSVCCRWRSLIGCDRIRSALFEPSIGRMREDARLSRASSAQAIGYAYRLAQYQHPFTVLHHCSCSLTFDAPLPPDPAEVPAAARPIPEAAHPVAEASFPAPAALIPHPVGSYTPHHISHIAHSPHQAHDLSPTYLKSCLNRQIEHAMSRCFPPSGITGTKQNVNQSQDWIGCADQFPQLWHCAVMPS